MKLHTRALLAVALALLTVSQPVFAQGPAPAPKPFAGITFDSSAASQEEATKIIALNALMSGDPERGMPLLEGILKGSGSPTLKDRAMSALTQSKLPRAQQVLTDYAKSSSDAELQLRAVRYIGRTGTKENQQMLAGIYPTATDSRVKQEILRSLQNSGNGDALLAIAKSEKDSGLRSEAIRNLTNSEGATAATLSTFYASETDTAARRAIISGLANRGDAKTVIELARKETDPAMKVYIVQRLGSMKNKDATDFMVELLK